MESISNAFPIKAIQLTSVNTVISKALSVLFYYFVCAIQFQFNLISQ